MTLTRKQVEAVPLPITRASFPSRQLYRQALRAEKKRKGNKQ